MSVEDWKTPPVDQEAYVQQVKREELDTQESVDVDDKNPENRTKRVVRRSSRQLANDTFAGILAGKGDPNRLIELKQESTQNYEEDDETEEVNSPPTNLREPVDPDKLDDDQFVGYRR